MYRERADKPARTGSVPARALLAGMLTLACAGCLPGPDLNATGDPLVVTGAGSSPAASRSPERVAAIADMRQKAEAGESMPYPDVFQTRQTSRLAAREEPRAVADSQNIEAELAAIATMRSAALSAAETAELDARARELRRLASLQRELRR